MKINDTIGGEKMIGSLTSFIFFENEDSLHWLFLKNATNDTEYIFKIYMSELISSIHSFLYMEKIMNKDSKDFWERHTLR